MQESGVFDGLQGVHRDLIAFSKAQLRNVDRLWLELDAHVGEFKRLLDKPGKSEASRKALLTGKHSYDHLHTTVPAKALQEISKLMMTNMP